MRTSLPVAIAALILILLLNLIWQTSRAHVQAASGAATPPPSDRLAEPTLPPDPDQADLGAQAYWLHCMACHGDRGQGLTGEFRRLYPPEHQNCWESGCHGAQPYPDGWTLPARVPELIGPGALANFEDGDYLYTFIRSTMPYHSPASLDQQTYRQVTVFLLRQNGRGLAPELAIDPELPANQSTEFKESNWLFLNFSEFFFLVLVILVGGSAIYFLRSARKTNQEK